VCACLCLRFCCFPLPLFSFTLFSRWIFHWFRGFKRFLLIVLGFICLIFYFFICNWSSWFLVTGVRSNSTRARNCASLDICLSLFWYGSTSCAWFMYFLWFLCGIQKKKKKKNLSNLFLS
jgi:hypothetical protein